jgi:hypothetical protein
LVENAILFEKATDLLQDGVVRWVSLRSTHPTAWKNDQAAGARKDERRPMSILPHCCEQMKASIENSEIPIRYTPKFREYGIEILDGGTSKLDLCYCPWCGTKLPESLRDDWFDRLEELGVDPFSDAVPEIFQDDRWWIDNTERP